MLPFEAPTIFEQLPRFIFKMPRVVQDQKAKFESDELFRRLSRESEVRYTGYRDRPLEERKVRFQNGCREGITDIAFIATGTNLQLIFNPCANGLIEGCDFQKEPGKVYMRSRFIMNGVCTQWKGWINLEKLEGVGALEYDEERGAIEEKMLKEQMERYVSRMKEFEERQRLFKEAQDRQAKIDSEQKQTPAKVKWSELAKNCPNLCTKGETHQTSN